MAKNITLTEAEEKLAALIWRNAPLKKLCEKGVFKNENANVSVLLTRDEQIARQSRRYVEDTFGGSLPKFITSFFGGRKLTPEQAAELKRLIEEHEGDGNNG